MVRALLFLALFSTARADDWPQWRGPDRDAVFHERNLLQAFPKAFTQVWRAPVGLGWSSPVVAQGDQSGAGSGAAGPPT